MTTSTGRSTETRRSGRSVSQWLLGLLIVLALAASILMVFTDTLSITGSLAVIAALWAAVIGAILVTKFRRQAESAEAKSRDLRLVYELQLEREIAARRQYELDVETTIRKEVSAEANEELAELKAQVLALRSSLEVLIGEPLPDQRAALPSEKLRELASGLGGAGYASRYRYTNDDDAVAARDFATTAPAADDGRHIESIVDPNEMTEVIPVVTDDPISGRIATEVPLADESDDRTPAAEPEVAVAESEGAEATDIDEANVADAEIVEPPQTPQVPEPVVTSPQSTSQPATSQPATSQPATSQPFSGGFYVGPTEEAAAPLFTDDTPTDEWAVGAAAAESTRQSEPANQSEPAREFEAGSGRHEGGGDTTPAISLGGRRRRTDTDAAAAHTNGLPVSELLNQLRQAPATGGRRRRPD